VEFRILLTRRPWSVLFAPAAPTEGAGPVRPSLSPFPNSDTPPPMEGSTFPLSSPVHLAQGIQAPTLVLPSPNRNLNPH
jgi:hypothetical protein